MNPHPIPANSDTDSVVYGTMGRGGGGHLPKVTQHVSGSARSPQPDPPAQRPTASNTEAGAPHLPLGWMQREQRLR